MQDRKTIAAFLAALALATVVVLVSLNERASRSPTALLERDGKVQMLYPYGWYGGYGGYGGYPYDAYGPAPVPYDPYGYGYGYDGYADYYDGYQQYAAAAQQQQYSDYVQQQQYADYTQQHAYYNWATANSYYKSKQPKGEVLRVADGPNAQKLVYMGDFEFGGYRKDITGGNDGGYNAPFDLNGDGQEVDNWAKVSTQWKHKKGATQLKQKNLRTTQLAAAEPNAWETGYKWYRGNKKPWSWFKNPPGLPSPGQVLPGGRVVS